MGLFERAEQARRDAANQAVDGFQAHKQQLFDGAIDALRDWQQRLDTRVIDIKGNHAPAIPEGASTGGRPEGVTLSFWCEGRKFAAFYSPTRFMSSQNSNWTRLDVTLEGYGANSLAELGEALQSINGRR